MNWFIGASLLITIYLNFFENLIKLFFTFYGKTLLFAGVFSLADNS